MMKKYLSILLCLCMVLSLLPTAALAADLTVSIGTTNLTDGKYYTVKTGDDPSFALVEEANEQPAESTPYLYFSGGILTVSGDVSITSIGPFPLAISYDKLTIGGSGSLSLSSSNSPAISISDAALTLSGSVDFSAEQNGSGAVPAIVNGSMETEDGYSGDITVSSNGNSAFNSMSAVDLQTTSNISISGGGSASAISGSGAVTLKGGTVSLTNSNSSGGQLIITGGENVSVSVTATSGDLSLNSTSALPLLNVNNGSGEVTLSAPNGSISVTNSGAGMAICGALTALAGGNITFESTGGIAVGGSASISADGDIAIISGSSDARSAVTGALTVTKAACVTVTSAGSNPTIVGATDIIADGDISIKNTGSGMAVGNILTATSTNGSATVEGKNASAPAIAGITTITAAKDITITSASTLDIGGTAALNAPNGIVIRSTSAGSTVTTADGGSYAYGGDVETSGLDLSSTVPTVTTRYKAGSGYISYIPATTDPAANAKLELHGAQINTTSNRALTLPADAPVDIVVASDSSLMAGGNANVIMTNGQTLSVTGSGDLTLVGPYYGINVNGSGAVSIDIAGDLTFDVGSQPISTSGDITVSAKSVTTIKGYNFYGNIVSLTATDGDISLTTKGSFSGAVSGSGGVFLTASKGAVTVNHADNASGGYALQGSQVLVSAFKDVTITTSRGAITASSGAVSVTSQTGSIQMDCAMDQCVSATGAVSLSAAEDITLNDSGTSSTAVRSSGQAADITAGGKLTSSSAYGFQVGALTIQANEVSIAGTQQDGIQATSVSITNTDGTSNCKRVSVTATSSDDTRAAITALGDATTGNITVKADDLFICGKTSAKAINAAGTVTIEGAGLIVGTIAAGTKSIASGITCASVSGGDKCDGLNLSTAPAESTVYTADSGYVLFTPATGAAPATLTLHNATIHNTTPTNDETGTGIALPDGAITLVVEGTNTISAQCTDAISGSDTDVTLSGTGVLNVGYSGISLKSTAAHPHSLTKGASATLNGMVKTYDNSSENGDSDTNTVYGNVTYPDSGNYTLGGTINVTEGAVLTIPQNTILDLKDAKAITNNGTLANNGTLQLPQSLNTEAAVKALGLTGSGLVQAVKECDANGNVTVWDTYTNDGTAVKAVTNGLDLTGSVHNGTTVADNGYAWDSASGTLTLGNIYVEGGITLPTAAPVTINSGSSSTISGTIGGDGNAALRIVFTGTAPLTISGGINSGINGDTVTVQSGAQVTLNGYISLGGSGTGSTLNVTGAGTVLDITSNGAYGAICDTVNVQNGAALTVHAQGAGTMGVEALGGGVHVTEGSTLETGCDYGVYIIGGKLEVDSTSKLITNGAVAPFCIVGAANSTQNDVLSLAVDLPSGTAIASRQATNGSGTHTYWSLVPTNGNLTVSNTDNTPVTLAGAITGTLTFSKAASSPTGGGSSGNTSYTLTFETNGGSKLSSVSKTSGTAVNLSDYKPTRDGYDFGGWFSDAALTAKVTRITLTKSTTVYAKWMEKSANPFADISDSAYYHDAVLWAVKNGVTGGTSNTAFSPDMTCTRAQMAVFLWRAEGSPEPASTNCPFTDVSKDAYYYKAVLWAVEKGITAGTSATTFGSDDIVTRGQAVTFLWRAAGKPDTTSANPFSDVTTDAYYYDAVLWAVKKGVTAGTSVSTFDPASPCNRAQIVTFLYRYAGE